MGLFGGPIAALIIGFVQSKGGVGKTTTALNVAGELLHCGKWPIVFDADSTGSAALVASDDRLGFPVVAHLVAQVEDKAAAV